MTEPDHVARIPDTVHRWATAERAGDSAALRALLSEDFAGIGPHGFQLGREQWLARYRSGSLVNERFTVEETTVRDYGTAAIINGVPAQQAAYQGHPANRRFRLPAVLVAEEDVWSIVHVQLSAMPEQ